MREQLLHGHFKGNRNRWEHVLRTEFAKGFVEPVPALPVALVEEERVGSPMPPELRARLAVAGLLIRKDHLCFTP